MTSQQQLTSSSTSPLDVYFHGIRKEYDRLIEELDEVRKQRDEYKTNYKIQEKELREFRINHQNQEKELREFITSLLHRLNGKDRNCERCRGDSITELSDNDVSIRSPASSSSSESFFDAPDRMDSTGNPKEISLVEDKCDQDHNVGEEPISVENEDRTPSGFGSPSIWSNIISTNEVGNSGWDVEYNGDTEVGLKLDLAHELTQEDGANLAFSPDGKYLASASTVVCIFDVNTGRRISMMRDLYRQPDEVYYRCLGFSPNNSYLATGEHGRVTIWIISQRRVRNIFRLRDYVLNLNFSPNGQNLVTCSFDRTVRIWRLRDGFSRVINGVRSLAMAAQFSPDGRYVASGIASGEILIWNVGTGRLVARWEGHRGFVSNVSNLLFTPDGMGMVIVSQVGTVVCWDIAWLSSLGISKEGEDWQDVKSTVTKISRFAGHTGDVLTVSISFDGKWIASASDDKTVRIWNVHDGILQCTLHCPAQVRSASFSPDGTYLAIRCRFPQFTIWNFSNLQTTAVLPL